jgi:hypothetical protein
MERGGSRLAVVLLGALGLAAVTACQGPAPVPFPQLETSTLQAVCHLDVLCGAYPDQSTCLASHQVETQSYYDTLGQDIESGKVVYDGDEARACIDKLNAASCTRDGPSPLHSAPACLTIFTGTVAVGGACFFAEECASGDCQGADTTCSRAVQCCPGTCASLAPPVAAGGSCLPPALCAPGLICVLELNGTATCRATVGAGAPCPGYVPCASGLYCDSVTMTCKIPGGAGAACNPARDSTDCDIPYACDATTSVCTPPLPVGAACDPTTGGCVPYASCDAATGSCAARPSVGDPCDPTGAGPACLDGACDATTALCTSMGTGGACS